MTIDKLTDDTSHDGGYSSRKLWYSIGTSGLIFIGAILSGKWSVFGPHYETMISGLIGVLALYLGGNVSNRFLMGKVIASTVNNMNSPIPAKPVPAVKKPIEDDVEIKDRPERVDHE